MQLVYWATPSETLPQELRLEHQNSLIVEQVTFRKAIQSQDSPGDSAPGFTVEAFFEPANSAELLDLAIQAGHSSRFRLDTNFGSDVFRRLYQIWIERSCTREIADSVLVIRTGGGAIAGMITLRVKDQCCSIGLIAVAPEFRRKGLGGVLMRAAQGFAIERKCQEISVVTQFQNSDAIRLYEAAGFSMTECLAWFHFWLREGDRAPAQK